MLNLSDSTVAIAAIGCQTEIAAQDGDHARALKANHPMLWTNTARLFGQPATTVGVQLVIEGSEVRGQLKLLTAALLRVFRTELVAAPGSACTFCVLRESCQGWSL